MNPKRSIILTLIAMRIATGVAAMVSNRPTGNEGKSIQANDSGDNVDLPDIDTMLAEASDTVKDFTDHAAAVDYAATKQQQESMVALSEKRAEYIKRLAEQDQANDQRALANDGINASITFIHRGNEGLMRDAAHLRSRNRILRDLLNALSPKIGSARTYLDEALNVSSTNNLSVLRVLDAPQPKPTLDHFLSVMGAKHGENPDKRTEEKHEDVKTSLLQVNNQLERSHKKRKKNPEDPEAFIDVLKKGLDTLNSTQHQAGLSMKAAYLAHYEISEQRTQKLEADGAKLKQALAQSQQQQNDLHAAKNFLAQTGASLAQRTKAIQLFLTNVRQTAMASLAEDEQVAGHIAPSSSEGKANATAVERSA